MSSSDEDERKKIHVYSTRVGIYKSALTNKSQGSSCVYKKTYGRNFMGNSKDTTDLQDCQRDAADFLGMYLKGDAQHFYEQLSPDIQKSYERAIAMLKKEEDLGGQ